MDSIPARELQRRIRAILDRVEGGESIQITRRGRPIARLVPEGPTPAEPWPDLAARARGAMGRRRVHHPPSQQVADDRGER